MSKFFIVLCIGLLIASCAGIETKPIQECIVDQPDGTQISLNNFCAEVEASGDISYICGLKKDYEFDPCIMHRSMEVLSKEGLILDGYTFEEFKSWADYVKGRLDSGLTYDSLKTIVLAQFTKINKMVGAQILIFGDMFLQMPQQVLIPKKDVILIDSSIDDLVAGVKELDIWAK